MRMKMRRNTSKNPGEKLKKQGKGGKDKGEEEKEGRFIDVVGQGGSWWLVAVDEGPVVVPNGVVSII